MMNQVSYVVSAGFFVYMGVMLVSGHPTGALIALAIKTGLDMAAIAYIDKKAEELKLELEKELNGDTTNRN